MNYIDLNLIKDHYTVYDLADYIIFFRLLIEFFIKYQKIIKM